MNSLLISCLLLSAWRAAPAAATADQLIGIGKSYADKGENDKAIAALTEALAGKPKSSAEAEYLLGLCCSRQDRLGDASAHLERATALDPKRYDAWLLLGMTRDLQKDAEGAAAAYRKAIDKILGDATEFAEELPGLQEDATQWINRLESSFKGASK